MIDLQSLAKRIERAICKSPDLILNKQKNGRHPLSGACYIATEALYHLGGREAGYMPQRISVYGISHWYLKHKDGTILDITGEQFGVPIPYENGKGAGFLTKKPCKRTQTLISRL